MARTRCRQGNSGAGAMVARKGTTGAQSKILSMPLLVFAAALLPQSGLVQDGGAQTCKPRAELVELLETRYEETQVAAGVGVQGMLIEVFAAQDGSTWTMLATSPHGVSCTIAAGEGWRKFRTTPVKQPLT